MRKKYINDYLRIKIAKKRKKKNKNVKEKSYIKKISKDFQAVKSAQKYHISKYLLQLIIGKEIVCTKKKS